VSLDGGGEWTELGSGLPTISVRDIAIQERDNDLAIATFGRGFYILDDYSSLRQLAADKSISEKEGHIFEIADAFMYAQTGGKYGQGSNFYYSKNPEFGATFTYYLKEVPETLKAQRKEKEKALFEDKQPIPQPTRDMLRAEAQEVEPYLVFSVYDEFGAVVRKLEKNAAKGLNRVTWNLRYDTFRPVSTSSTSGRSRSGSDSGGLFAMPGNYSVGMELVAAGEVNTLSDPVPFKAVLLHNATLPAENREALVDFQKEVSDMARVMMGTQSRIRQEMVKVEAIQKALKLTPGASTDLVLKAHTLEKELDDLLYILNGPSAEASWEELSPMAMPLNRRLNVMVYTHWSSSSGLTKTEQDQLAILKEEFPPVLEQLKDLSGRISQLNDALDALQAPWTPGRMPELIP
jgi:hypothetical protein